MNIKYIKKIIRTRKNLEIYGCISTHQDHTAYIKLSKKQALDTLPDWAVSTGCFPTDIIATLSKDEETKNWKLILG